VPLLFHVLYKAGKRVLTMQQGAVGVKHSDRLIDVAARWRLYECRKGIQILNEIT
jgi:hypothetical protein